MVKGSSLKGGPPSDHGVAAGQDVFELRDGTRFRLDAAQPHVDVFRRLVEESEALGRPLYVERQIGDEELARSVLLSKRRRIMEIGEEDNRMVPVLFEVSHAQTFIDLDSPDGEMMLAHAREAVARDIPVFFVMRAVNAKISGLQISTEQNPVSSDATAIPLALTKGSKADPLSGAELETAYNICAGLDYIPFSYPGDCCAYRAWEMRRTLNDSGFECGKLFLYPGSNNSLKVSTANHPDGYVCWTYHVAPIVYVTSGAGPEPYVIDPSLFERPATQQQWVDRQPSRKSGGENRSFREVGGQVFFRAKGASDGDVDQSPMNNRRNPGNPSEEAKAVKTEFLIHYGEKIDLSMRTGPYKKGC
ncbi:MAG: hypothetical protein EOS34_28055 [Mesorhizobium sp.]|nr:MAG: hypothetical protein EOS34_28055 [Mesorhizobium sp.]